MSMKTIKGSYRDCHNGRINNSFGSRTNVFFRRVTRARDAFPLAKRVARRQKRKEKKDRNFQLGTADHAIANLPISRFRPAKTGTVRLRRSRFSGNIANCFAPNTEHVTRVKVYSSIQGSRSDAARKCVLSLFRSRADRGCAYLQTYEQFQERRDFTETRLVRLMFHSSRDVLENLCVI